MCVRDFKMLDKVIQGDTLLLTFGFLLAKEALGHFGEELLGRAGRMQLWNCHTATGRQLVRSETLRAREKMEWRRRVV